MAKIQNKIYYSCRHATFVFNKFVSVICISNTTREKPDETNKYLDSKRSQWGDGGGLSVRSRDCVMRSVALWNVYVTINLGAVVDVICRWCCFTTSWWLAGGIEGDGGGGGGRGGGKGWMPFTRINLPCKIMCDKYDNCFKAASVEYLHISIHLLDDRLLPLQHKLSPP